jgi:glycosyltransferase involved in cell wall biosynthesis
MDGAQELNRDSNGITRVLFSCSGVGIIDRGIETFFREAFDGLRGIDGVAAKLVKGGGYPQDGEEVVWNLPRTGQLGSILGRLARRNAYVIEQWSTFLPVVRQIRKFRPHVVFYSDANLGFLLYWFRKWIGVPYQLLFSNGGPCHPPFVRTDFVHQVAPYYYQEAIAAGEPADKHFLIPYGINVPDTPPSPCRKTKCGVRTKLGLPQDRPIVLSVGWISRSQKRMDYVIQEVAGLPKPRPFLQLLGAIDRSSQEILELGQHLLGEDGFSVRSATYDEVADYYRASDVFVLASLAEGFGRVLLEALMHGLPVIAHQHPVIEFVVGEAGSTDDLSRTGALTKKLAELLDEPVQAEAMERRWSSVRTRFDWQALRPHYREMFLRCAHNWC